MAVSQRQERTGKEETRVAIRFPLRKVAAKYRMDDLELVVTGNGRGMSYLV